MHIFFGENYTARQNNLISIGHLRDAVFPKCLRLPSSPLNNFTFYLDLEREINKRISRRHWLIFGRKCHISIFVQRFARREVLLACAASANMYYKSKVGVLIISIEVIMIVIYTLDRHYPPGGRQSLLRPWRQIIILLVLIFLSLGCNPSLLSLWLVMMMVLMAV